MYMHTTLSTSLIASISMLVLYQKSKKKCSKVTVHSSLPFSSALLIASLLFLPCVFSFAEKIVLGTTFRNKLFAESFR